VAANVDGVMTVSRQETIHEERKSS